MSNPTKSPTNAPTKILDRAMDMAKDSAKGLSTMEMVGVAISIICALASLVFAYWKWKAEKKRISIQKENAELERTRIESQKEVDKIEAEGKDRHLLLLIFL